MPYAISNLVDGKEPSARAVKEGWELAEGETLVGDLPAFPVWDAATQQLRGLSPEEVTAAEDAKATEKIAAFDVVREAAANDDRFAALATVLGIRLE